MYKLTVSALEAGNRMGVRVFDLSGVSAWRAPRTGFLNDVLESMSEYEAGSVVRARERGRASKHLPHRALHRPEAPACECFERDNFVKRTPRP